MKKLPLTDKMLELVARRFRVLGEPCRLRVLQTLEQGEKTVNELVEALAENQSNISKHLKVLYEAGLVGRRRKGTSALYSISDPLVFKLCELVCHSAAEESRQLYEDLTAASKNGVRKK